MYDKINKNMRLVAVFTLIVSTVFVIAACYSIFTSRLKSDIESMADTVAAILDADPDNTRVLNSLKLSSPERRFTLIAPDGTVLFDSLTEADKMENHAGRPEITEALKTGRGSAYRYSATSGKMIYYYAEKLSDGKILRLSSPVHEILKLLVGICIPIFAAAFLIYILTVAISVRLTENIIKPIEKAYNLENYDDVYEELRPFLKRISAQNNEIRQNMEELRNAEKIRREFSANVSHELKTPLTAIKGYSQLIKNKIAHTEDVPMFAGKIEKEAGRLIILIDDIIKLSNLDEGNAEQVAEPVDLRHTAEEVTERLEERAAERGISIELSACEAAVRANPIQIDELIYNLVDNAIKYNKDNGKIYITVGVCNTKPFVTVRDTGIGIPEKYLDRIFERFFRVDKSHSKKINGTGLGLSIVKHIAIINNASISVMSAVDEGTSFTVEFDECA